MGVSSCPPGPSVGEGLYEDPGLQGRAVNARRVIVIETRRVLSLMTYNSSQ